MDVFNFCWKIVLDESKKYNVHLSRKSTSEVKNDMNQNFTRPVSRIAYLYKFGSYNISLFNQCFKEFYTKGPDSSKIIDDFLAIKNLTICSISVGPGTDIIGLLYSLYLVDKPLVKSTTFRIVSKYGEWRNLVSDMINSSSISVPDGSSCHLIGCRFLKSLSKNAQSYLKAADILLMCDTFSPGTSKKKICDTLKRIFDLLKPGVLVFLMFSKEKSTYFKEWDCSGSFLYGPVEVKLEKMPYDEKIAELVGVKPLDSGKSMFSVWQKFPKNNPELKVEKDTENSFVVEKEDHSSNKFTSNECGVKDINSPILSLSSLKREFSSDTNISSSDSIASSSQFSSSSNSIKIINRKVEPVVPDNSINFNVQNINSSESHVNSLTKNGSSLSLNASESLVEKKCASPCKGSQKKIENKEDNDMNSLLKNFQGLITKFEGLISSQSSLNPSSVEKTQTSSDQHSHQNMNQGHCRCSVKPCQLKRNCSACCHSMCFNDTNHNCSTHVASNLYRTLPQDGPCLVIPLENLSNESLVNILSILSQNSSANKTTALLETP